MIKITPLLAALTILGAGIPWLAARLALRR